MIKKWFHFQRKKYNNYKEAFKFNSTISSYLSYLYSYINFILFQTVCAMKKHMVTFLFVLMFLFDGKSPVQSQELNNAWHFLETGKPDSAAVLLYELVDSLEDKNERVRALYYLALTMEQLGRIGEKINYLIMAMEVTQDAECADKVRLAYAHILLESGNLDECIKIANEFRENYSTSPLLPDMLYIVGEAYILKGEYLRASNTFNEIIKNHESSDVAAESIMKVGICLYNLDLIAGAIEQFEHYLLNTPQGVNVDEALYFLGLSYERSQQPELASNSFNKLILEYPSYTKIMDAYFRLGENYYEANQFIDSENAFLNYISNIYTPDDSRYDEALLYLERIKFKTGVYALESDIAEHFIAQYPESPRSPQLLFDLARYYQTSGKPEDAIEKYKILMNNTLYAAYADSAIMCVADTYVAQDKKDMAIAFLTQQLHESVDSLRTQKIYYKLGSVYEEWKLYGEAITWYEQALTVNRSSDLSFHSLWGIGRIFLTLNRWYEATKTFERAISDHSNHPDIIEIYLLLAKIYFDQGRLKDAIRVAEESVKLADDQRKSDILLFVAELYEESDENHALKLYFLIYNNPQNSSEQKTKALLHFGDLALKRGNHTSALNAYAKILNSDADTLSILKAKRKISLINDSTDSLSIRIPYNR